MPSEGYESARDEDILQEYDDSESDDIEEMEEEDDDE